MMTVEELGRILIDGVPFELDPEDSSKFVLKEYGVKKYFENILQNNFASLMDYKRLSDTVLEERKIEIVNEIFYKSRKSFTWAYNFCDKNYPGAKLAPQSIHSELIDDYFMVYLCEMVFGGYKSIVDHLRNFDLPVAKEIVRIIINYGDWKLKRDLEDHRNYTIKRRSHFANEGIVTGMELLRLVQSCYSIDHLKNIEFAGHKLYLSLASSLLSDSDNIGVFEAMMFVTCLNSFIHGFILENKIPTSKDIADFLNNPQSYLRNYSE